MSTDKNIPIADPSFDERASGVAFSMSYHSLVETLRKAGIVKKHENVRGIRVNDTGLTYYVENKDGD